MPLRTKETHTYRAAALETMQRRADALERIAAALEKLASCTSAPFQSSDKHVMNTFDFSRPNKNRRIKPDETKTRQSQRPEVHASTGGQNQSS